ncbi:putative Ubiquitin-associated/translation elongation factor EF1B [Paratrimastix pyriformis]|uniref:Ubiquitin-associated/translation elongation factor EF1B n=1 Tax=Paratrimastix pyriformis TaxID=342808 RepID=A0ABQ8ULW9_9EUKA|nr:putative Ubiquitin-associated/translation elongation factor EF1B [Paratrimastix pyriformis]
MPALPRSSPRGSRTKMSALGEEFGPEAPPLSQFIQKTLREYTNGSPILNEILQNADDARAERVCIMFDKRTHHSVDLPDGFTDLTKTQGPALIAFNSGIFEDRDFESIQHIGQSGKERDPRKTGKFGLGFLSVYHWTDTPQIVSHETYALCDPLHTVVHTGTRPGKKWSFAAGTIIRLPLRKVSSDLSGQVPGLAMVEQACKDMAQEADTLLLNLKHVQALVVTVWDEGATAPRVLTRTKLVSTPAAIDVRTSLPQLFADYVAAQASVTEDFDSFSGVIPSLPELLEVDPLPPLDSLKLMAYSIQVESWRPDSKRPTECHHCTVDDWLVSGALGGAYAGRLSRYAASQYRGPHLIPFASIAAKEASLVRTFAGPLSTERTTAPPQSTTTAPAASLPATGGGHVFCFLPLPGPTGLPVHVNAHFVLSSNRCSIMPVSAGITGESRVQAFFRENMLCICEGAGDKFKKKGVEKGSMCHRAAGYGRGEVGADRGDKMQVSTVELEASEEGADESKPRSPSWRLSFGNFR